MAIAAFRGERKARKEAPSAPRGQIGVPDKRAQPSTSRKVRASRRARAEANAAPGQPSTRSQGGGESTARGSGKPKTAASTIAGTQGAGSCASRPASARSARRKAARTRASAEATPPARVHRIKGRRKDKNPRDYINGSATTSQSFSRPSRSPRENAMFACRRTGGRHAGADGERRGPQRRVENSKSIA